MHYQKPKSVSKQMLSRGEALQTLILETLKTCSDLVGSTLGPGGMSVVIERQEVDMPPIVTKDGVTVFKALGFENSAAQVLMESARDCAVRTASEAGDGPQPLWSQVLTPAGFVKMGDIRSGMRVCGTQGTIQEVLGVYGKGQREIFKVTFAENQIVECCEDHLWTVTTDYGAERTLTTKEIARDFKSIQVDGHSKYRYYTPKTEVEFTEESKQLALDPYLVGVLLGDGCLRNSGFVELTLGRPKEHILEKLVFPDGISIATTYVANKNSFRVKITGTTGGGETIRDLADLIGLRNSTSDTKFIPKEYLLSSGEDRRALLQGLLDIDGHINTRGRFEFSTGSRRLAEDFVFLARSLGKSVQVRLHTCGNDADSYSEKSIYRITELKGDRYGNKIVDVEATGRFTEMQCIKVSNPDNLYITDGMIVTHNTTTSTILAESFARKTQEFCKEHRHVSPQRVSRILQKFFETDLEPQIKKISVMPDAGTEEGQRLLHGVARISANGDSALADATMKAFEIIGDAGNVTIVENMGPSGYAVEKIDGYPVPMGYEDCCGPFLQKFVNDIGTQMCVMEKPSFILYYGKITDFNIIYQALGQIAQAASDGVAIHGHKLTHNVVVVASGFSETVLANLAAGFVQEGTLNIFPLRVPPSPLKSGVSDFLADMAALTGGTILDPIERPFQNFELEHLGAGITVFESGRFRSNVIGHLDELLVLGRVDEITKQLAELQCSELDKTLMRERVAKLTSGIAKLVVTGSSHGEVKERRDRAEDAVCAVRGAIKHGVLPGGGTVLTYLSSFFEHELYTMLEGDQKLIAREVVAPALLEPVIRLFLNAGYSEPEAREKISQLGLNKVYDILERKFVDPLETYLLDSTPAVLEALRNAMSIAGNMGTCGGVIVFKTDTEVNRQEARDTANFLRSANINEADERG